MNLDINITGMNELKAYMKRFKLSINARVKSAVTKSMYLIEKDAKKLAPVNTGRMRASISKEIEYIKNASIKARVGTNVGYGYHVECGRPPGSFPPVFAMQKWVAQKGLLYAGTKKKIRANTISGYNDVRNLEFLISRNIARHGIKAKPFMKPAMEKNFSMIKDLFVQAISDTIREA
jgi:HK97 gp10 family phage protein